jgi:CRP/FNR family transcriptional regulator, polysaccharide utilization system transcription regulator
MNQLARLKRPIGWTARDLRTIYASKVLPWFQESGRTMTLRRGEVLFHEGEAPEGVYLLKAGRVELSVESRDGRSLTTRMVRRGQFFGLEALFTNSEHDSTARATGPATVCYVPRLEFFAFLDANPDVGLRILHILSEDLRTSYGLIRSTLDLRHERSARHGALAHAGAA